MGIEIKPQVIKTGVEFGATLRACRLTAGIGQTQLAAMLGVTPSTIAHRETGRRHLVVEEAIATLALCGYVLAILPATDVVD